MNYRMTTYTCSYVFPFHQEEVVMQSLSRSTKSAELDVWMMLLTQFYHESRI